MVEQLAEPPKGIPLGISPVQCCSMLAQLMPKGVSVPPLLSPPRPLSRDLEDCGAKEQVMRLVGHRDPDVRIQALLALQKVMVQNW